MTTRSSCASAGRSTNHRSSFLNPSLYPSSFLVSGLAPHITREYHVCSPNIVTQFARIAQATNFVYCHSIIEANQRSEYNPSPGSLPLLPCRNGEELVSAELHTFFPFDPYKLPRSGSYIQGVYREWTTVAIEGDEESDEEEDDGHVDEGDGEFDHGGMLSVKSNEGALGSGGLQIPRATQGSGSDADGLGESFGGMSISPAQPVIMAS